MSSRIVEDVTADILQSSWQGARCLFQVRWYSFLPSCTVWLIDSKSICTREGSELWPDWICEEHFWWQGKDLGGYATCLSLIETLQVVGEAQGDEASLQNFIRDLNEGPKHAHVIKVEKSTVDTKEGESSFECWSWTTSRDANLAEYEDGGLTFTKRIDSDISRKERREALSIRQLEQCRVRHQSWVSASLNQ